MQNAESSVASPVHLVKLEAPQRTNAKKKIRREITPEEMAQLPPNSKYLVLACGKLTIVDEDNFEELSKVSWSMSLGTYPASRIKGKLVHLHRLVANTPYKMWTDHINGQPLDNRRCNLRTCTQSQNMCNKIRQSNNTSGHVGVSFYKPNGTWRVQVKIQGVTHSGGYHANLQDAILARTELAKRLHGNFVKLA